MARLLIIKTGQTHERIRSCHGDFQDWFSRELSLPGLELQVCNVAAGDTLPGTRQVDGAVVTGSPAMVTDRPDWSEACGRWLAKGAGEGLPLLGVCYGHHLLADALGGEVGFHPQGREIGTRTLSRLAASAEDPLFGHLPETFVANLSHKQSVLSLPPDAEHLVRGDFEPNQVFRWGASCWGCQFHPEFDRAIMQSYIDTLSRDMVAEGLDVAAHRQQLQETPEAAGVLIRFARLVHETGR